MNSKRRIHIGAAALIVIAVIALISVIRGKSVAAATPQPPPGVQVAAVQQRDVPIQREWIGTLNGLVNAAINAEVTGYLLQQDYAEGSFVHKGQLLFEIDPRPFQAAVDQAAGQLAQAKAQLANAEAGQLRHQLDLGRFTPLAEREAA